MKKIIFVLGLMATMIACTGNSTKQADKNDSASVDTVDTFFIDTIHVA